MSNVSPGDLIGPLYVLGLLPKRKKSTTAEGFAWDNYTLTQDEYNNSSITLSQLPYDPLKVTLIPSYGIEQQSGIDFVVEGTTLSWQGLALQLLLNVGDTFSVRYIPAS